MTIIELQNFLNDVETQIKEFDRPSANNSKKMLELLTDIVKNNGVLPWDSGIELLSYYAKNKLEYINGSCIARDFPNKRPTLEWAGAVLDLLEELGLNNYR
jgi:hypothetical protein